MNYGVLVRRGEDRVDDGVERVDRRRPGLERREDLAERAGVQ
jgi:hypothetical protein